jgi:hypothetical protein
LLALAWAWSLLVLLLLCNEAVTYWIFGELLYV